MKNIYLAVIAGLIMSAQPLLAQGPSGTINFDKVDTSQVLMFYAQLSGLTLIEDSRAKSIHRPIRLRVAGASKTEAMELIEEALRKQAGIVVTHLDNKSVSVTYNDALPIAKTKQ